MPIYVGYSQKRRRVKLLTAGDDQTYLCNLGDITLQATVSDITNTRNHTFEWEQISGPEVILTTVDEFTSTFPFNDTNDKVFRFWVDKGTAQQQYKDVNVFYTPTDIHHTQASRISYSRTSNHVAPNLNTSTILVFDAADTEFNDDLQPLPVAEVNFDYPTIGVFSTSIVYKFEILGSTEYHPEPTEVVHSYLGSSYPTTVNLYKGTYRFKLYFDNDGRKGVAFSKTFTVQPGNATGFRAVNTQQNTPTFYAAKPVVSQFLPLKFTAPVLQQNINGTVIHSPVQSVVRVSPKFINWESYPNLSDEYVIAGSFSSSFGNVVRSNPTNIGS